MQNVSGAKVSTPKLTRKELKEFKETRKKTAKNLRKVERQIVLYEMAKYPHAFRVNVNSLHPLDSLKKLEKKLSQQISEIDELILSSK